MEKRTVKFLGWPIGIGMIAFGAWMLNTPSYPRILSIIFIVFGVCAFPPVLFTLSKSDRLSRAFEYLPSVILLANAIFQTHSAVAGRVAAAFLGIIFLPPCRKKFFFRKVQKAAEKGSSSAQEVLGEYYYAGIEGAPQNYADAVRYFRMAADQKHPTALAKLGLCYRDGTGVECDLKMASRLFKEAAELGNETAGTYIDELKAAGLYIETLPEIPEDTDFLCNPEN